MLSSEIGLIFEALPAVQQINQKINPSPFFSKKLQGAVAFNLDLRPAIGHHLSCILFCLFLFF